MGVLVQVQVSTPIKNSCVSGVMVATPVLEAGEHNARESSSLSSRTKLSLRITLVSEL